MDLSETKNLSVTHEPAKLDEASKLLLKAADFIETRGWAQHDTMDCYGRLCVRGALMRAAGVGGNGARSGGPQWGKQRSLTVEVADKRLELAVGKGTPNWNNDPKRTQAEVVAKLRAVALAGNAP